MWKVINDAGISKVLEYRSPGRHYILLISYAIYRQELRVVSIILKGNKKTYAFTSIEELKTFLFKRKVPPHQYKIMA